MNKQMSAHSEREGAWDAGKTVTDALLVAAVNEAKESVVITDADLCAPGPRIVYVNAAFTRMSGYTADEVLGKSPRILQGPATDRAVIARLKETLARGDVFQGETINYRKDGGAFHVEWQISPVRDRDGKITHFASFQQDISARRRAEQRLAESEQRYRMLVERSPGAIFVHSEEKFVFANAAAATLLGAATTDELLGLSLWSVVHPDFHAAIRAHIVTLATDQATPSFELRFNRLDGSAVDVEVIGLAFTFDGKAAVQVIAFDLTQRRQLEEQFRRAQRLESFSMLASGIAHDLNNVLAPIQIAAPLLRHEGINPKTRETILFDIERSVERGAELIRQIHDFSHGLGGKHQTVEAAAFVRDVVRVLEKILPPNVRIERRVAPDMGLLRGATAPLHQLVLNLALNAGEAMPHGGRLTLTVEKRVIDEAPAIAAGNARAGAWVVIDVSDTGEGIPDELLPKIWAPFFSTKPKRAHAGLGLSTAKAIVEEHGGFISVKSTVGVGTCFSVYLPAGEECASRAPEVKPAARGCGELILIVDEQPKSRLVSTAILLRQGFGVLACGDRDEALQLMRTRRDDVRLVLISLSLPDGRAAELAAEIRQLARAIRIVATGMQTDAARSGLATSFDDVLPEAASVEDTLAMVHALIPANA
jgi:PAS domain S-box-containing protein